jgi:hypothetical protein
MAFGLVIIGSVIGSSNSEAAWLDDWNRMESIVPKGYVCYRTIDPIDVDGRVDEDSWQNIPWTEDFADIQGDIKPRPRFRTHAKMLWDDEYFYVGAELEEPHVWATLTEHDSVIFHDNDFEIFIDPDGDNHEYYEIEINALGTEWDLLLIRPYKDGGPAVDSWEIPGLKVGVNVEGTINDPDDVDKNWTVEVAIPWKVLAECAHRKAPPADEDQWRVNFSRVEWEIQVVDGKYQKIAGKPEDNWVWSPQGIINMHCPEKWGYVQFSEARVGEAEYLPDPSAAVRNLLHRIYYAQKDYRQKHGNWAATLAELGLEAIECKNVLGSPEMQVTQSGFEVVAVAKYSDGKAIAWHIRQDSRVWMSESVAVKEQ